MEKNPIDIDKLLEASSDQADPNLHIEIVHVELDDFLKNS